jgi:flagellar basal body P-ring formation protein FlgA
MLRIIRLMLLLSFAVATPAHTAEPADAPAAMENLLQVQAAAEREATQRLPTLAVGQRLAVGPIDPRLRLAVCAVPLAARPGPGVSNRDRLIVEVQCAAPNAWHLYVPVKIVGAQQAVRTRHALLAGQVVREADIEVIKLEIGDSPPGALDGVSLALDQIVARPIAAGSILSNRDLLATPAIQKGQTVTLLARNGAIDIKMAGRALGDAFVNQRVRAANISSGRIVDGVAASRGVVEVNLPAL